MKLKKSTQLNDNKNTPIINMNFKALASIISASPLINEIKKGYEQGWIDLIDAIKKRIEAKKPKYNLDDFDPLELFPQNNKYKDYIHIIDRLKIGSATLYELAKTLDSTYLSRKKFKNYPFYSKTTKMRIYALRKKLKENTGFRIILKDGKYKLKNIYVNNSKNSLE